MQSGKWDETCGSWAIKQLRYIYKPGSAVKYRRCLLLLKSLDSRRKTCIRYYCERAQSLKRRVAGSKREYNQIKRGGRVAYRGYGVWPQ